MIDSAQSPVSADWNRTAHEFPRDRCIHELFQEQVQRTPDAVAVIFEGESLTYDALNRRANQLAHHLLSLGVGRDVLVGLLIERSVEMTVAVLAVLKAGGAYVPLDPDYPDERLNYMLANSGCEFLLTPAELSARLPMYQARRIRVDDWPGGLSDQNPTGTASSRQLAYLIYTSGSTGRPKGVAMEHRPLVNLMTWQVSQSAPALRTLQFASLSFDVSFQEIFATWLSGGTLVLIPTRLRFDPATLWEFISEWNVERLFLPVIMLHQLAAEAVLSAEKAASLKEIITAGEQLHITPAIRSLFSARPSCTLHNHYGPTESHVVTAWTLPGPAADWPELPCIGKPIFNATIHILDPDMKPVPVEVPGQAYIGGIPLARGYWNDPEKTDDRFVPSPFDPEARLYRTGDSARWLSSGDIEFLGRLDDQVKIRGYRIELGEIEVAMGTHPDVIACAVIAQHNGSGEQRLTAFVVARDQTALSTASLRMWLAKNLPHYMIPPRFVQIESLPVTPNGKLDRNALGMIQGSGFGLVTEYVAPRNEMERRLAEIWEDILLQEKVGVRDNFFELGGNSLLAARLAAEVEKSTNCKLQIAEFFRVPTIELLARRITEKHWMPSWTSLVPLQEQGEKPPLFFAHGWGGDAYVYLALTQYLAPEQPCYGLQAIGLDGKVPRHTNVEEMAAHYIREIRSFQPKGPYYLVGYSLGGLVAYEIAQQLHRQGQRVAFLGLLDTEPEPIPPLVYARTLVPYLLKRCLRHLQGWWNLPSRERSTFLRDRLRTFFFWLAVNRAPATVVIAPPAGDDAPQIPGFQDYYHAVLSSYRLRWYPGSVDIFVSDESRELLMSAWKLLVKGPVRFHRIPGDHLAIINPSHVAILADAVIDALQRAQHQAPKASAAARYSPFSATKAALALLEISAL